ncbi:MAG: hypothetical protein ACP5ON_05610 [Bacteroidota bacterium]
MRTLEEIRKILSEHNEEIKGKSMALANGGRLYYGRELFNRFVKEFPQFTNMAMEIFKKKFNDDLGAVRIRGKHEIARRV